MASSPPRGRWLLAGGVLGIAISAPIARFARSVKVQLEALGPKDSVAPFLMAPCERLGQADAEQSLGHEGHA